mgnify:CR=1 FL=1
MLYLDYSANTPVDEEVLQCFCEAERRSVSYTHLTLPTT